MHCLYGEPPVEVQFLEMPSEASLDAYVTTPSPSPLQPSETLPSLEAIGRLGQQACSESPVHSVIVDMARWLSVEIILNDPEAFGDRTVESFLYDLQDKIQVTLRADG